MANRQDIQRVKQGHRVWNAWKFENPKRRPDLKGADLRKADLRYVNLYYADLRGANLQDADLRWANFYKANLRGANLEGTKLHRADFNNANLQEAYFQNASLGETLLSNANLTNAHGLEECKHDAPSILDHRTFAKSRNLPLAFLRGCGLPDILIEYIPVLRGDPIHFYSCFISYSSKDEAFAVRLHADLQDVGVRVWFAPQDLKIGDQFRSVISDAILRHDKLLLILSEHSVESDWVEYEVEKAVEYEQKSGNQVLFPVRTDDSIFEESAPWARTLVASRHIGDFLRWKDHDAYRQAFSRLVRDLETETATETNG